MSSQTGLEYILGLDVNVFYKSANQQIFKIIQELSQSDFAVTTTTVLTELTQKNYNQGHFLDLLKNTAISQEIPTLIKQLKSMSHKRSIVNHSMELFNDVQNGDADFEDFVVKLDKLNNDTSNSEIEIVPMSYYDGIELDDIFSTEMITSTGFKNLDRALLGFKPANLYILAASPGSGKSTLAIQLAMNTGGLFFSYEMTRKEIYLKLISKESGIDSMKIEAMKLNQAERDQIAIAREKISPKDMKIIDKPMLFPMIVSTIRKYLRQYPETKMISIDYLQLILAGSVGANQEERISHITRTLKLLAMELNISILLLSQLTKAATQKGYEVDLSSLRGSGSIGQDANVVIFLYEKDNNGHIETVIDIAKSRGSRTGVVNNIQFAKETSNFKEFEYSSDVRPAVSYEQ
jgi:replicative DNA helicase